MSTHSQHAHVALLEHLRQEFKAVLDESPQAIYAYLDNEHKICNQKYASLLGYKSAGDWEAVPDPMVNVEDASINALVTAYKKAVERKLASTLDVTWKTTAGKLVQSSVILVPLGFHGELIAIHYITAK